MRYALRAALIALCLATPAAAQQFPITMPAGTVYGRTNIGAGPGQAIPFANLAVGLAPSLPSALGQPYISAKATYGVVCDGVTNDTAAIGNAFAGANGQVLVFPPNATCVTDPQIINAGGYVAVGTFTAGSAVVTSLPTTINMRAGQAVAGYTTTQAAATTTNGSPIVTFNSNWSTGNLSVGMSVTGTGIPAATTITSIDSSAQFHISNNATASGTPSLTFTNTSIPTTTIKSVDTTSQVTLNAPATANGTQQITFSINNMPRAIYAYGTTFLARASSTGPTLALDNIPGGFNSFAIYGLKIDANNLHAQALKLHGVQFAYLRDIYLVRGTAGGWWLSGEPGYGIYNNLFENIASFGHTGAGVIAKTINNPGPSPQTYIAANGFLNITSQNNTSFGLDVNWANLNLVAWRSELNSDCGINVDNTQELDLTGPWLEANKSPDCSIASTANTLNVKIHGGQMLGTITAALLTAPSTVIFSSNVITPITYFGGLTFTSSGVTLPAPYNLVFTGSGSGTATIVAQAAAGTPTLTLPTGTGTFAVTASAPLSLNTTTGALSITGAAGQVLAGATPAFTATPTLGASGTLGSITFGNATSGLGTLQMVTGALGSPVISLPAATDTLMGKATLDTLTNKTYDTAGSGNIFKINGTTVNAVTGTGSTAALSASPVFTGTVQAAALNVGTNLALPTGAAFAVNKNAAALPAQSFSGETFMARIAGVDGTAPVASIEAYGSFAALVLQRADGTGASPTAVQSGEMIGAISAHAFGATVFNGGAGQLRFVANQTWTDAAQGTYVSVWGTPNGSVASSVAEIARFLPSAVTIGSNGASFTPSSGTLFTATKNAAAAAGGTGGMVAQVVGADTTIATTLFDGFHTTGPFIVARQGRGTGASFTATQNTDALGFFGMVGASGANTFVNNGGSAGGVYFGAKATENWSGTNQGAKLQLYTTPNTTAAIVETLTLQGSGGTLRPDLGIPAGGTAGFGFMATSTSNFGVFFGSGVPSLSAAKGSLYLRSDGTSTSTRAYINTDGGTTWTNLTTGA